MSDWKELTYASSAASVANFALRLQEKFKGPKPELDVSVKCTGGGSALDFAAYVSEVRNQVPALRVTVVAEIEDDEAVVAKVLETQPFNLAAGEMDKYVPISVPRPQLGTLVKACNDAPTLYGRDLVVTAFSENGGVDVVVWREERYDPEADRGRYEAMQVAWRSARGEETEDDGSDRR